MNRRKQRVNVLTEPQEQGYAQHAAYAPGAAFPIPSSVAADGSAHEIPVDVALLHTER